MDELFLQTIQSIKHQQLLEMGDEMIQLYLDTASEKLRELFPIDNKSDVTIIFRNQEFKLQKAYLRLQSKYFESKLCGKRTILEIDGDFQDETVYNILHLIYGAALQIQRVDSFSYFEFIKFLGIDPIIRQLQKDMLQNFEHYDIFQLFDIAIKYEEEQIFQKCLNELEAHNYIQIKEHKKSLLRVSEQIFKLVIKAYNRITSTKILSIYQIVNIINEYAEVNHKKNQYAKTLRFELIDISKLTSQEYNQIFVLQELSLSRTGSNSKSKCSCEEDLDDDSEELYKIKTNGQFFHENCFIENELIKKSRTLEMQKTLQQKIKLQLDLEKEKMTLELNQLKQTYSEQMKKSSDTHDEIVQLKRSLSSKSDNGAKITVQLESIDRKLLQMSRKVNETTKKLQSLVEESSFYIENHYRKQSSEEDKVYMLELQHKDFVIPDMSKLSNSFASTEDVRDKLILEDDRLQFDIQPITIYSEEQLLKLRDIITSYRFSKKRLTLLFKRSLKKGNYGQISSLCNHKNNLLFLIRTTSDKLVGARIYENLTEEIGAISDSKAFLFSVTQEKKFEINPECVDEAISMSKGFIICFSTDLMIAQNCLQEQSYCEWPNSYAAMDGLTERASDWLVGAPEFSITDLQCYEIEYLGVDMVL